MLTRRALNLRWATEVNETPIMPQIGKVHEYLFGYRISDRNIHERLPKIPPVKESLYVSPAYEEDAMLNCRAAMSVTLGCHLKDTAPFKPDLNDTEGSRASAMYRLGRGMFKMTRRVKRSLKRFAISWAKKHFKPIDPTDVDVTVEYWIDNSNYSETDKQYYHDLWRHMQEHGVTVKQVLKNKGFVKEETYQEEKYPRNIYGPSDYTKILLGPIFKAIENVVFEHPAFIKHIKIQKRAAYINRRLGSLRGWWYWTDHTCFEAGVSKEMMEAVEFPIYEYLASALPGFASWFDLVKKDGGTNFIAFRNWWMTIAATRLSGRMNTSLGNGLVNLITQKWVAKMSGAKVKCCCEGDDCIAKCYSGNMDMSWFKQLGMIVKFEEVDSMGDASFVGMVFGEDGTMVRDPMKFLVQFGWSTRQYVGASAETLKCLARSKALSAMVETPQAPIISAVAKYVERTTRDVHPRMKTVMEKKRQSMWDRERWLEVQEAFDSAIQEKVPAEPTTCGRLVVEKHFGVPIELQLQTEDYFNNLTEYGIMDPPNLDCVSTSYYQRTRSHYDTYVRGCKSFGDTVSVQSLENFVAECAF